MPKKKQPRLAVTQESDTGRNQRFRDTTTGEEMSRTETVRRINRGAYDDYHIRTINGVKTPVSNPNGQSNDNLG